MKKEYTTPKLRERKLSITCMLETSTINIGDETEKFDAKENTIFDRFDIEEMDE